MESFNAFLNYPLIESKTVNISPYHLIIILILLFSTVIILKLVKRIFTKLIQDKKIDSGSSTSVFLIIKYIIWVSVIAFCLETVGIKLTILIASSAALLVGLGLGIQQIFHDIASGIILLFERNLKVNDIIELENNIVGKVSEIGLRTSKILTRDNIIMIIPNSKLISDNVINWSHNEKSTRFYVEIGVAYGSNTDLVKDLLLNIASKHNDISKNRETFVRFVNFGDSSLDFRLYFWTKKNFVVEFIKSDLRFAINRDFAHHNIKIPFPQRDINIQNNVTS
jgi:small-conductance mechanosensitive channel